MRPLLLALLGSPHPQGANAHLLSAFCQGFSDWRIKRRLLSHLAILPCQGCQHCLTSFRACPQADAMPQLIEWLEQAQALVLAAPVYFYGFPAQTKAVIDRCHALWHNPVWKKKPKRPAFFISTCDATQRSEFQVIVREARAFLNTIAFTYTGDLLVPGMGRKNAVSLLSAALPRAQKAGKQFAQAQAELLKP